MAPVTRWARYVRGTRNYQRIKIIRISREDREKRSSVVPLRNACLKWPLSPSPPLFTSPGAHRKPLGA
ncbi:hypothetical protein E2C01_022352 [Portunus trituberculatus]|uniref:Uncharacterized protein n=1 Tax=Portunus trituberculatus TaxID=210409 RepID=A0A5B7E543_PORTR|nr:hypothetical protein [Portunus trituberculatus]